MHNSADTDRLRKFFYAEAEAGMYDDSIELTVPMYKLIHDTIIKLLDYHFNDLEIRGHILDIGIGTGAESLSILRHFNNLNIVGIDLCQPMSVQFGKKYEQEFGSNTPKRYEYKIGDFLTENIAIKANYFAGVISAYCIHHFSKEDKFVAYQKIYETMSEGAIFVNADLFNYEDATVSKFAHDHDIEYISSQFDNPSIEFEKSRLIPFEDRMVLKEKWIHHMNHDNILNSVECQLEMLKKIGFKKYGCVFRFWQQGIIYGIK
jgi:tRNA (cmo5U34)-methyltransferase